MASIFIDGFDKYGTSGQATNLLTQGEWTSTTSSSSGDFVVVAPLSVTGYALSFGSGSDNASLSKTLPASYNRLIGGVRISSDLSGTNGMGVAFGASGSWQSAVVINPSTGTISIMSGTTQGTVLATSATSITANVAHFLEWDITFGASAAYNVWLDGVLILNGTGNTGGSSVNQLLFGSSAFTGKVVPKTIFDDLYLFDTTTTLNNAALLTNPRIETQLPNANSAVAWSPLGADTNWLAVAMNPAPGTDTEAIQATNAGTEDLYDFPALTHNPAKVYTVAVKANTKITITGTRLITAQTKSGSTDSAGSNSAGSQPALSYDWIDSYFDTDPNTSAAWTPTAVNAATSGVKVKT